MRRRRRWQLTKRQMRVVVEIIVLLITTIFIQSLTRKYLATNGLSSLWQNAITIGEVVLLWTFVGGYYYKLNIVGFSDYTYVEDGKHKFQRGRTLWDWLQLLVIPAVLAGAALWFNIQNAQTQQAQTIEDQREAALQAYIDSMSEHLLKDGLRKSLQDAEIRSVARTRTLSTLRRLDEVRKGQLVQFLSESGLIISTSTPSTPIISLRAANLFSARLADAHLRGADLTDAILIRAELVNADLAGADLSSAQLTGASIYEADLTDAILIRANLTNADLLFSDLTDVDLTHAKLERAHLSSARLTGAILIRADLSDADLSGADLSGADLSGASLRRTDLTGANLTGADLSGADLTDTTVAPEQLALCKSLTGATMPDGSKHN